MAKTVSRRGRPAKKPATRKRAETKKKVDKLFEDLPQINKKATAKTVAKKPAPKDTDSEWLLEQSDASVLRIKELEEQVIQYKDGYEKLLEKTKTSGDGASIVSKEALIKLQNMFTEMVQVRNRQGIKSNIILDYSGSGPQGLLQQLQAIFPFLK